MRLLLLALSLVLAVLRPAAGGALIANDAQLRDDLSWLVDRGLLNTSLTSWPLNTAELARALGSAATDGDPAASLVMRRVGERLRQLQAPLSGQSRLASGRSDYPGDFAQTPYAADSAAAAIHAAGERWVVHLRGAAEERQIVDDASRWNLNGSYVAGFWLNQWLSFGELPQWWGPGHSGSLIRSDAARPLVGAMLQRGEQSRWNYQLFAGQLRQYQRPERPKIFGGRLTLAPTPALEIGLSRVLLWGGKGRPENAASFRNALFGRDNTGDQRNDPGDQLGGVDFRLRLAALWAIPLTLYGQLIGEDEAGGMPSHNTYLLGMESHLGWGTRQINGYLEAADTRSELRRTGIIYYHYCYQEGFYQQGWPLAWGTGGDASQITARVELVTEAERRLSLRVVGARVNRTSQSFNRAWPEDDRLTGVTLDWSEPLGTMLRLSPQLWYSNSQRRGDELGAALGVSLYLYPQD